MCTYTQKAKVSYNEQIIEYTEETGIVKYRPNIEYKELG